MLKKILLALMFVITAITNVAHAEDDMKTVASKAYVDTKIETKQLKIPAAGQPNVDAGETVMTYTSTGNGQIGERGLYSDISSYDAARDGDKLITASALNATFTNLPTTDTTKLECANPGTCSLWNIIDQTAYTEMQEPYVSATGTGVQDGTPTPTNPIYPTFYQQGDMILRRVGDYADSYDATTHKITRNVGEIILNGTENWTYATLYSDIYPTFFLVRRVLDNASVESTVPAVLYCSHFLPAPIAGANNPRQSNNTASIGSTSHALHSLWMRTSLYTDVSEFKQWLADQYAAGTPVIVYYPLATPVEETWTATTYSANASLPQNQ